MLSEALLVIAADPRRHSGFRRALLFTAVQRVHPGMLSCINSHGMCKEFIII